MKKKSNFFFFFFPLDFLSKFWMKPTAVQFWISGQLRPKLLTLRLVVTRFLRMYVTWKLILIRPNEHLACFFLFFYTLEEKSSLFPVCHENVADAFLFYDSFKAEFLRLIALWAELRIH